MKLRTLLCLTFIALFIFSVAYAQAENPVTLQQVEALKTVQARHENSVFAIPGVVGLGIGLNEDGQGLAFIVYVEKMTDTVQTQLPYTIEGVPVRVIESGIFKAY
jgi:hypothetical protein